MSLIRLDKLLADMGIASRKELKQMIKSGRVSVDGVAATVPEMKLDVIYPYDKEAWEAFYFTAPHSREELLGQTEVEVSCQIDSVRPYSNHEVLWGSANREFYELLVEKAADPQWYEAHFGNPEIEYSVCIGKVEGEFDCLYHVEYYYNAQTGTHLTRETGVFTGSSAFEVWWEEP